MQIRAETNQIVNVGAPPPQECLPSKSLHPLSDSQLAEAIARHVNLGNEVEALEAVNEFARRSADKKIRCSSVVSDELIVKLISE